MSRARKSATSKAKIGGFRFGPCSTRSAIAHTTSHLVGGPGLDLRRLPRKTCRLSVSNDWAVDNEI